MKVQEENGQALVLVALGFCVLCAFLALAVDVGMLFQAKRKVQVAADAAAMAGAMDYLYNQSSSQAITQGQSASSANGYTDGTNATVTMSEPAADGPNSGTSGMVEAVVSTSVPTFFMGLMGKSTMTVQARAVAGTPTNGSACIWLMNPTSTDLYTQGSYNIQAPNCGMYMNSTSSSAVSTTGNGGTLNALFADAVGGSIGHQTSPTAITTYTVPRTSPWGNLIGPTFTTSTTGSGSHTVTTYSWTGCTYVDSTTTTLGGASNVNYISPGTGIAGAGKTICFSKPVTISNATFGSCSSGCSTVGSETISQAAGTLVFAQGVTISSTVTVYGGTIDIAGGTFTQPSNILLSVVSPTSGTYNGIALMQPKTNTNQLQVQFGSNNQILDGYIYAPGAQVYLQDNGGGITATGIVADSMLVKSSTIHIASYDKAHPTTSPNRVLTMVE